MYLDEYFKKIREEYATRGGLRGVIPKKEEEIGQLPETVVKAEEPIYMKLFRKLKDEGEIFERMITSVQQPIGKAVEDVTKFAVEKGRTKYGELSPTFKKVAPTVTRKVAELPGDILRYPAKYGQAPWWWEIKQQAYHDMRKNFGTEQGQQSATRWYEINNEMIKRGIPMMEQAAIEVPIQMYFTAQALSRGVAALENKAWWDKFLQTHYEKRVLSQEDVETITSHLRRGLIDRGEDPSKAKDILKTIVTAKEVKVQLPPETMKIKVGDTYKIIRNKFPTYKVYRSPLLKGKITPGKGASFWTPKELNRYIDYVDDAVATGKAAAPRAIPALTPEARYGITPAGKLAPKVTPKPVKVMQPSVSVSKNIGKTTLKPWDMTDEEFMEGGWGDFAPLGEDTPLELPSTYREIAKNEGVIARDMVYELHRLGVKTIDTHALKNEIIIHIPPKTSDNPLVRNFIKENNATVQKHQVGDYIVIKKPVPTFLRPQQSMQAAQAEVVKDMVTRMGLEAPRHYPMTKPAPHIKEPTPLTRAEARVLKAWNEMSLIEKYRYTHGGKEPPLTTGEIAQEVDRLMTEKLPPLMDLMYQDVTDMARAMTEPTVAVPGLGEYGFIQPPTALQTVAVSPRELLHTTGAGGLYGPAAGGKSQWQLQRGYMQKAVKELKSLDLKHMRPEFQKPVQEIISQFDLSLPTPKTVVRLQQMAEYIANNPENNIPVEKLADLKRLDKVAIRELKLKDVDDIVMAVRHYTHLNKLKNNMIFGRRLRMAKEIIKEGIGNILKIKNIAVNPNVISSFDVAKPAGSLKKFFTTASYHPETMTMILDGKDGGVVGEVIYGGINDGIRESMAYEHRIEDWWKLQHQNLGINLKDLEVMSRAIGGKKVVPRTFNLSTGRKFELTSDEVIALIMHARNSDNLRSLIKGGFRFPFKEQQLHRITLPELKEILSQATPQEIGIAKAGHEFFDRIQKNAINRVTLDLNGFEIATQPYYWHKDVSSLDRKVDYMKPRKNFMHATLEGMGMLKERMGAKTPILLRGFYDELFRSIRKSSAYVGLAKPLRNAKMMMNDGKFKQAVIANFGRHYWTALDKYLRYMEDSSHDITAVDELGMKAMQRFDFYTLGLNPGVMMKQLPSWFMATTEIPGKYLIQAETIPLTGKTIEEMRRWSPPFRDRIDGSGFSRETYDIGQVGAVRRYFTGKTPGHAALLKGVRTFDLKVISRIWNAAKIEVAAIQPNLSGDAYWQTVARRAEEVVRRTQPAPHPKDRPELARHRGVAARLLTKYTTQRNQNYNQIRRAFVKYGSSGKTPRDKAKLIRDLLVVTVVSSAAITAQNELVRRALRKKPSSWLSLAVQTVGNTIGYAYGVGDVFNSLVSKIERGEYGGYDYDNLLTAFIDDITDLGSGTYRTLEYAFTQEEYKSGKNKGEKKFKKQAWRTALKSLDVFGKVLGIPLGTARRYLQGLYRWGTGEKPDEDKKEQKKSTSIDRRKQVMGY